MIQRKKWLAGFVVVAVGHGIKALAENKENETWRSPQAILLI